MGARVVSVHLKRVVGLGVVGSLGAVSPEVTSQSKKGFLWGNAFGQQAVLPEPEPPAGKAVSSAQVRSSQGKR